MKRYYDILGISPSASRSEIKKAYRALARKLHPDVNPSPEAHDQFIELTEAYEYLLGRRQVKTDNSGNSRREKAAAATAYYQDWAQKRREEARRQAREYARMKYEKFRQSEYYQHELAVEVILNHLALFFFGGILLGIPLIALVDSNWSVMIIGIVVIAVLFPLWQQFFGKDVVLGLPIFWKSLKRIAATRTFVVLMLGLINLLLIQQIVVRTMVSHLLCLGLFIILMLSGFYFVKLGRWVQNDAYYRSLFAYGFFPLALNLVFLSNFLFATNPAVEDYPYTQTMESYRGKSRPTSTIILKDHKYQGAIAFRFFFSISEVNSHSRIILYTAEGLWGWKVVRKYELRNSRGGS